MVTVLIHKLVFRTFSRYKENQVSEKKKKQTYGSYPIKLILAGGAKSTETLISGAEA